MGWLSSTLVWHDFRTDHDDRFYRLDGVDYRVLRAVGLGWQSNSKVRDTPLDTLKHRFARGEIDRAEYEDRKKLLSD